jgi:hypothetical protein
MVENVCLFIGNLKIVAGKSVGRSILRAPAGPPKKLGSGFHTVGPKTPASKKYFFINLIPIAKKKLHSLHK